jgi:hypothetical protein
MKTGRKNLIWTKHRNDFIFSVSSNTSLGIILYVMRKDFLFHWIVGVLFLLCLLFPKVLDFEKKVFSFIGHTNSKIILTVFYFIFFSPFSLIYKLFFRHDSFKASQKRLVAKTERCDFERPF